MLKCGVSAESRVIRLNYSSGNLGSRIDAEFQFSLLSIVYRKSLHKQRSKSRSSSSSKRMEDQESLKTSTLIRKSSNSVKNKINYFFTDSIVTSSIVVSSILLSSNQLFRMKQLSVSSSSYLIYNCGFKVDKHSSGNMFSSSGFRE